MRIDDIDVKAKENTEKTIIELKDNEAAFIIDDEGAIKFHVHRDPETEEGSEILEPHELIVLAFSLMYVHDIERVVDTCQKWLEEVDPQDEVKN
jgi:hypothetical protein